MVVTTEEEEEGMTVIKGVVDHHFDKGGGEMLKQSRKIKFVNPCAVLLIPYSS